MNERITEFCQAGRGRIDRAAGIIHGCKILGRESRNNRSYPQEVLRKAAPLYEGVRVFSDHATGGGQRSIAELLGTLRGVRCESDGLRADFHYNVGHPLAAAILWAAENAPDTIGFSHAVEARTSRANGRTVVTEIVSVQSCDLVCNPASVAGLFEARTTTELADLPRDSADFARRLRGGRPSGDETADFAEKLRGRGATTSDAERADFVRALLKGRSL